MKLLMKVVDIQDVQRAQPRSKSRSLALHGISTQLAPYVVEAWIDSQVGPRSNHQTI